MTAPNAGRIIWITGRPSSGKSTLARTVVAALKRSGVATLWLDSDDLRTVLTPAAEYTSGEREQFYAALGHIALLAEAGGIVAVVSATASRRAYRDRVRARASHFTEVFLDCDEETLRRRDAKGLYAMSDRGEISKLPGAGAPYEPPEQAELALDSGRMTPERMADAVLRWIDAEGPAERPSLDDMDASEPMGG